MIERVRKFLIPALAVAVSLFTIYEVNYSLLPPLSQLAVFALLGLVLSFLWYPASRRVENSPTTEKTTEKGSGLFCAEHPAGRSGKRVPTPFPWFRAVDLGLAALTAVCCGYVVLEGSALAGRAGEYTWTDFAVAVTGTLLVIEATRRTVGLALPLLSVAFLLYAFLGPHLPEWMFFHRGYDAERVSSTVFLTTRGVFGTAMRVMFTYVFLFVVFGAFLEISGATQFIVAFAQRVFGRSAGGPAKVSVLASGLMGSLSGSAVANAVTTGSFTIPLMRSAGFRPHIAGGVTAAAASGGALVPPVMGAGAYMMLELVPDVTFVEIMRAAIVPAILYYLSILLIVHFYARRVGTGRVEAATLDSGSLVRYEGFVFFAALGSLIAFLLMRFTPFRAVTYALEVIVLLTLLSPRLNASRANRGGALAALGLITAGVAIVRTSAHAWMAGTESAAAQSLVKVLATAFAADANLRLSAWTTWADAAIPGLVLLLLVGLLHAVWRPMILEAFLKSARGGVALVSASGCVGIIIGVVLLTGFGTAFPNAVVPLAEESLLLALVAIMACSIVLGMGLPSAVCYLLMATLIGPVLNRLGVPPLAAHLFIFYFGMMSMVTPPVALAAYATASIAGSPIMQTGLAAFRFSLVGFTLPFMFVYRPELLLMDPGGGPAELVTAAVQIGFAVVGIAALAAGLAGYVFTHLRPETRLAMLVAAALLLSPDVEIAGQQIGTPTNIVGCVLFAAAAAVNWARSRRPGVATPEPAPSHVAEEPGSSRF